MSSRTTQATVAVVGLPGPGHVNPTLAVVRQLLATGDRVVYYAPAPVRAAVTGSGAEFRAVPTPPPPRVPPQSADAMRASLVEMGRAAPWLADELARLGPDVVLFDSLALVGWLAARAVGLPAVSLTTTYAFGDAVPAPGSGRRGVLTALRHRLPGLRGAEAAAVAGLWPVLDDLGLRGRLLDPLALTGDATVVLTTRTLQPCADGFGADHHFVGPAVDGRSEDRAGVPWERLAGPLVYVSFGTHFVPWPGLLDATVAGVSDLAGSVLVSTGRAPALRAVPPNVVSGASMPQLAVLDRASVVVTHGGMNTVHEALRAGVPMVVVPHGADQPLVGAQIAALGAGVVLAPQAATAAALRDAVGRVLADPGYARRAAELGAEFGAAGGAARAAEIVHRTAGVRGGRSGLASAGPR